MIPLGIDIYMATEMVVTILPKCFINLIWMVDRREKDGR